MARESREKGPLHPLKVWRSLPRFAMKLRRHMAKMHKFFGKKYDSMASINPDYFQNSFHFLCPEHIPCETPPKSHMPLSHTPLYK
jgi:hypothetical protein